MRTTSSLPHIPSHSAGALPAVRERGGPDAGRHRHAQLPCQPPRSTARQGAGRRRPARLHPHRQPAHPSPQLRPAVGGPHPDRPHGGGSVTITTTEGPSTTPHAHRLPTGIHAPSGCAPASCICAPCARTCTPRTPAWLCPPAGFIRVVDPGRSPVMLTIIAGGVGSGRADCSGWPCRTCTLHCLRASAEPEHMGLRGRGVPCVAHDLCHVRALTCDVHYTCAQS